MVLKDDKTYVSLRLSVQDKFPAPYHHSNHQGRRGPRFRPPSPRKGRQGPHEGRPVDLPHEEVPGLRLSGRTRPCVLGGIDKCPAPCMDSIDEESYRAIVDEISDFLMGKNDKLLKKLEEQIEEAARNWNFEDARAKKEKYLAIKRLVEKQSVHEHLGINRDVWGFLVEEGKVKVVVLAFRKGVLISKRIFRETSTSRSRRLPLLLSLPVLQHPADPRRDRPVGGDRGQAFSSQYLKEKKKGRVRLHGPSDSGTADMIRLAVENLHEVETTVDLPEAFRSMLHLTKAPNRIEIYDNSHSHGQSPSGAMVVFEGFKPKKEGYRVFHIRDASPEDDVAMMTEVLSRRIGDERIKPLPDLVIVDGGKSQLFAALTVFKSRSMAMDVIGIAKGERRKRMEDILYLPFRKTPLLLPKSSPVFKEIVRMRDEAHRFAIASHKKWKRREDITSGLARIRGVGKKRLKALLTVFPSTEAIREAGVDGIARLPGFTKGVAEEIMRSLRES